MLNVKQRDLYLETEQQREWVEKLEGLAPAFREQAIVSDRDSSFSLSSYRKLQEIGYTSITLPVKYGGEGMSPADYLYVQEHLAMIDENLALTVGWTLGIVGEVFNDELWEKPALTDFGAKVAAGATVNRALSEIAMGSPTRGGRPTTTAILRDEHWVINGRKSYTTGSYGLDYFLVMAWIEEEQLSAFFLVHKDTPGVSIVENWDVFAMNATASHDLLLEEVTVPASKLVEYVKVVRGKKVNAWGLHTSATYVGIAHAARNYAVEFAKTHQPNSINEPIASLPNVQQLIGEMDLLLIQSRHLLYTVAKLAHDPDKRALITNELAIVKYTVTNNAQQIVDKAMRVVGAKSLQTSNLLQRYYRNVRAGLHNPPMDDMTIHNLAQAALKE
ncbi:MAG: acyl-CoA dehydrogenase family protein [Solibacillus sp.]